MIIYFIYYVISTIIFVGIITDRTNKLAKFHWMDAILVIFIGWLITPIALFFIFGRYIGYLMSKY